MDSRTVNELLYTLSESWMDDMCQYLMEGRMLEAACLRRCAAAIEGYLMVWDLNEVYEGPTSPTRIRRRKRGKKS